MKIGAIGDIHGRDNWEICIDNHPDVDKWIFTGDYCDSYTYSDPEILLNLNEIIHFKKQNPEKVVLLHGNHDMMQYYLGRATCSGFRSSMYPDLYDIFRENYNLFKTVHLEGGYLFSHAGVTQSWLIQCNIDYNQPIETLVEIINEMPNSMLGYGHLAMVSRARGGRYPAGSCVWCDFNEFYRCGPLPGVIQVFGHTPQGREITTVTEDGKVLWYGIDVLEESNECLILEI